MIIETSDNKLYRVRETLVPELSHCWNGYPVKRDKGAYIIRREPPAPRPQGRDPRGAVMTDRTIDRTILICEALAMFWAIGVFIMFWVALP